MKSDIEINQNTKLSKIEKVAKKINLTKYNLELYGNNKAKLINVVGKRKGKLILVTAINPTKEGEGKTTVSIGLTESLNKLGKKTIITLREPSMGPVFGTKGGATGGGMSQVAPATEINLNFTGDIHAVTSANNLIAAAIDNSIYWGNKLDIQKVFWKRCMDMNDRSLRDVKISVKKNFTRDESFQISAASEIMAILSLAKDVDDLKVRIEKIVIGLNSKGEVVFAKELKVAGSVSVILKDAIKPNLVQTLEANPAIIHGGPFANIAHGCNSIIATDIALKLSDFVVTEAGFGADLGMEKFLNIKSRIGDFKPNVIVIVATIKALKQQGDNSLLDGLELLDKHIDNIKGFNLNYVVALNSFSEDSNSEIQEIKEWAKLNDHPYSFVNVWKHGGEGGEELANKVLDQIASNKINFTYDSNDKIKNKIALIAKEIYGAKSIKYSAKAEESIKWIINNKLDRQYVCIAKTPASITDDANISGLSNDWTLNVNDVSVSNGAGFLVIYCGKVMTMPGLSKKPSFEKIDLINNKVVGLD